MKPLPIQIFAILLIYDLKKVSLTSGNAIQIDVTCLSDKGRCALSLQSTLYMCYVMHRPGYVSFDLVKRLSVLILMYVRSIMSYSVKKNNNTKSERPSNMTTADVDDGSSQ